MKTCIRCGGEAQFGYKKKEESVFTDYCHECFEIDHPTEPGGDDLIEVKNEALRLLSEKNRLQ